MRPAAIFVPLVVVGLGMFIAMGATTGGREIAVAYIGGVIALDEGYSVPGARKDALQEKRREDRGSG